MKVISSNSENISIELSSEELGTMTNALNQVCNGFRVLNFEEKIGTTEQNAAALLTSLANVFRKANFDRFNHM